MKLKINKKGELVRGKEKNKVRKIKGTKEIMSRNRKGERKTATKLK